MARKRYAIPQYGTVIMAGKEYYRTRIEDADGKRVALYGIGGLGARHALGLGQGELALIVKVDQRIEAVLIPEILGDPVIPYLAHHVEGQLVERLVRVGGLPLLERRSARLFELGPDGGFQMLDGVGAKAIDAEAAHPVGVPGDEVVAHRGVGQGLGFGVRLRGQQRR